MCNRGGSAPHHATALITTPRGRQLFTCGFLQTRLPFFLSWYRASFGGALASNQPFSMRFSWLSFCTTTTTTDDDDDDDDALSVPFLRCYGIPPPLPAHQDDAP